MNAIELLKTQHKSLRALLERIESAPEDEKEGLSLEIADTFAAHALIEEDIFYPAAYENETEELLSEAVEEHLAIKRVLADLLEMTPDDVQFDAKLRVLREQFEHHVGEEESSLFRKVRSALDAEEMSALGEEMQELFEEEMRGAPRESIPGQTEEAARIR